MLKGQSNWYPDVPEKESRMRSGAEVTGNICTSLTLSVRLDNHWISFHRDNQGMCHIGRGSNAIPCESSRKFSERYWSEFTGSKNQTWKYASRVTCFYSTIIQCKRNGWFSFSITLNPHPHCPFLPLNILPLPMDSHFTRPRKKMFCF